MPEANGKLDLKGVAPDVICNRFSGEGWGKISVHVPSEMALAIYVNRQELVTILCTPTKLNCLVLGFLYAEGIISGLSDVANMRVCEEESLADVMLSNPEYELPTQRTLTSGCGGGTTFKTQGQRVDSDLVVPPKEVLSLMKQLQTQIGMYRLCGGVHASALSDTKNLLIVAEDIGRHNTLDKIQGECLLRGLSTRDRLLLSTGRVSSETLLKAAKMEAPVVVSRHSPTGSAVSLAHDLGIALVGHARGSRLSVYSHPERLGCSTNKQAHQT
ncbi:MAG: formate dehydrogenase accessory sulfurtransferase FdhD [Deltaproteobacteria bacterium]